MIGFEIEAIRTLYRHAKRQTIHGKKTYRVLCQSYKRPNYVMVGSLDGHAVYGWVHIKNFRL